MKKLLITLATYAMIASCNSLDLSPEDYYGTSDFWKNSSQVDGYVIGLHYQLREQHRTFFLLGEARGGTSNSGTSFAHTSLDYSSPIKTNAFTSDLTGITNWNGLYKNILEVNLLIDQLENSCEFLTNEEKSYYLGQGYGLRAFLYFHLYKTFGGLPLRTDPSLLDGVVGAESLYLERSTASQTLTLIKSDIDMSEKSFGNNLEIKSAKGQWSKYATLMLKSEIYIWSAKVSTGDYTANASDMQVAKTALESVLNKFSLEEDFSDVFSSTNKGNNEIIFALPFADGEKSNWVNNFVYQATLNGEFYGKDGTELFDPLNVKNTGVLRNEYKWGLFASMDDLDTRKLGTFLDCYNEDRTPAGVVMRKFMGIINSDGNRVYCDDYVIYRYADALLMMAEVENSLGGDVVKYINEVRERAYGNDYNESLHGYTNSSFDVNELAILHERDKEFVWEGKRWFDVVRMRGANGKSLVFSPAANYDDPEGILSESEAYKILWPIDLETMSDDPELENNPGYTN